MPFAVPNNSNAILLLALIFQLGLAPKWSNVLIRPKYRCAWNLPKTQRQWYQLIFSKWKQTTISFLKGILLRENRQKFFFFFQSGIPSVLAIYSPKLRSTLKCIHNDEQWKVPWSNVFWMIIPLTLFLSECGRKCFFINSF